MKNVYFVILTEILVLVSAIFLNYGSNFLDVYKNLNSAKLHANLLEIKLNEVLRPKISGEAEEISILFVGDIMLSRGVANQIEKNNDVNFPFLKIADYLKQNDIVFGNLEGPISDKGENQGSIYSFRDNPDVVGALKFAGFNVLNLANNHIWDWGRPALEDTMDILSNNEISWVGAGRNEVEANSPLVVKIAGSRIAFLGYTNLYPESLEATGDRSGVSHFEIQEIKKEISEIKKFKEADIIVVSFHWGEEYETKANESQKRIAHELIDAGADLIIGHHPHVVEETEMHGGKFIAYSLGNFVFDQNFSEETNKGLMIKVLIKNKEIKNIQKISIKINNTFQPEVNNLQ